MVFEIETHTSVLTHLNRINAYFYIGTFLTKLQKRLQNHEIRHKTIYKHKLCLYLTLLIIRPMRVLFRLLL